MKKLNLFAIYALVTPAIALGSGFIFAADTTAGSGVAQGQKVQEKVQVQEESKSGTDELQATKKVSNQLSLQRRSYLSVAPVNGMHASKLIGVDVSTIDDENVGSISDLIIDADGQVVAFVVGVGGFLGMGEKNVAIGWDKVMKSGTADEQKLRINESYDALLSAPEYKLQK